MSPALMIHMRLLSLLFLIAALPASAQLQKPVDPATLPQWMGTLVTGSKPKKSAKTNEKPVHSNAFIGTWTVETASGKRIAYWGDAHRIVLRELSASDVLQRATLIDLQHNVKLHAHWGSDRVYAKVDDLHIPQAGYFHDVWNDSITATGRSATVLGELCHEQQGTSNGRDSSWYWTTTAHPALFSDLRAWARWLNKGDLEHLSAFADRNAKAALRVRWGKHQYGPAAGGMEFTAITPGKTPMPALPMTGAVIAEERLAWINNSSTGRLPVWMRAFLGSLPPDSLTLAYTPPAVDRRLPDNRFIGTLTAETPSIYIGAPSKNGARDSTLRLAKYSYWADARRAVLIMDDPDDEGYLFYAVDLDHDVVMASHNEGHSHVIPKLEIASLEDVGLNEFGRGLELSFTARDQYRTILGRKCQLHTTSERFISHFMIPVDSVTNPVFDMRNWMVQRMGQKFKDLMFFGVADKPMPMAVMGTHLTSYKPGKAKPPVVDLSKYIVRDQRLREKRRKREEHDTPAVRISDLRDVEMRGSDMVPDMVVAEPMVIEARPDIELPVPPQPPPRPKEPVSGESGSGTGAARAQLSPYMQEVVTRSTNHFIGSAVLLYTLTRSDGSTSKWTVHYASDSSRMAIVSRAENGTLPNEHTRAYLLGRIAGMEQVFHLHADSTVTRHSARLEPYFLSSIPPAHPDTVLAGTRTLLGRPCEKRLYEIPTTRRSSWVDPGTPSLFHDVFGARKKWGGIETILLGGMVTGTTPGMPLSVDYTYHGGDHLLMRVLELKPGPVDPKVFQITKDSWKR